MMGFTRKQIVRYAVLPEIVPGLRDLLYTGFQHIPLLVALVYQSVRLLPPGHAYTNPANAGKFGVRHVVAEAANNLVISRQNIDQVILFAAVLLGLGLTFVQIALLGLSLIAQPVMAAMPTSFNGFFVTAAPQQDIAFMLMDLVFGIPDLFGSCVDPNVGVTCTDLKDKDVAQVGGGWILNSLGWPHPIHHAMHQLFQFYSFGLLIVATLIALYFMITVVAETAQTGTPFGKRFNHVWAPLRIVMAFGLLIPVGHGLNSSQYIVLYAAKFGSSFATNGWILFNQNLNGNNYLTASTGPGSVSANQSLVSKPNIPDVGGLLQFMYAARVCKEIEALKTWHPPLLPLRDIQPYLVRDPLAVPNHLKVELTDPNDSTSGTSYEDMVKFANGSSQVILRFGEYNPESYPRQKGNVAPICGEIILPLNDPRSDTMPDPTNPSNTVPSNNPPEPGAKEMQSSYWQLLKFMWFDTVNTNDAALNMARRHGPWEHDDNAVLPDVEWITDTNNSYKQLVDNAVHASTLAQMNSGSWAVDPSLLKRGWGAAGIWYNRVAELNGVMTAAVMSVPVGTRYPEVMEHVLAEKKQQNASIDAETRYKPILAEGGGDVQTMRPEDLAMAKVMWEAYKFWDQAGRTSTPHTAASGSALGDMINALLGLDGLYSMRRNEGVHPLAQLVGVGRSLVESAVKNIGFSVASATTGAPISFLSVTAGEVSSMLVGLFMTFATIGMTAGFVLFYVVPFMPFIYFFFAVGGWIKGIFEAMIGAPLWALAHIRIDGHGLPGSAAMNGYWLIFEVFLRPIMIIFGLLASITIFSALVQVLHDTWDLIDSNLTGFDVTTEMNAQQSGSGESLSDYLRSPIDEFFFTVVYVIIVYLMGMSSFKLIDLIPNNILRWIGASVDSFNDAQENPAQTLAGKAGIGGQQVMDVVGEGGAGGMLKNIATIGGKK